MSDFWGCELEESVLVKQQLVGDFWGFAVEESVLVGRPMYQDFQRIRYYNTLCHDITLIYFNNESTIIVNIWLQLSKLVFNQICLAGLQHLQALSSNDSS